MSVCQFEVRSFVDSDADEIVDFSLRAWSSVFASVRKELGDSIFFRLYPDWESSQAETVRASFTDARREVFVAVADGRRVGFAAVTLDAFWQGMGCIWPLGVDPDHQQRRVGERLTSFAVDHMRERGMDIAMVEAGYDTGHEQAEALYESAGFTLAPAARYFRLLDQATTARNPDRRDRFEIRKITERDLETIIDFSIRAWASAFASMRRTFGDPIFLRLYPDWKTNQADNVRASCNSDTNDVFVASADGRAVGFVAVTPATFWERMGEISIIAVDPDHQRHGVGEALTTFALDHMCDRGMDSAIVETGNDPGHAPARALYAATGFTLLPISRYFRLL